MDELPKLTDMQLDILTEMKRNNIKHAKIAETLEIDVKQVNKIWESLDAAKKNPNDAQKDHKSSQKDHQKSLNPRTEAISVKVKIPSPDKHFDRADVCCHFTL
jgi:hypothetical protein